jgi:chromosome segregation ATPase
MDKGKNNQHSPLVAAVHALQDHLTELERVGQKINATNLAGEIDFEHIQKLLNRFADCGEHISLEMTKLATHLQEAQARAQVVAQGVSHQAEAFNDRKNEQSEKLEQFRLLGERVRDLNAAIGKFSRPQGLTDEERSELTASIPAFEGQLSALIEELQVLRTSARSSGMKILAKSAESLGQSLQALHTRLREMRA